MFEKVKSLIRGTINLDKLIKQGLVIGENFHAQEGVIIDPGHCWLIEIGSNVTFAPRVHILAHDASTKNILGYTKIGCVTIGDNVFIGAGTIVLPGVNISSNTIIGAASVVTRNLESGVYVGNPCKKIYDFDEYISIQKENMEKLPVYNDNWTYYNISDKQKQHMKKDLKKYGAGFIV